ncbi:MAG: response regulator transcription factor [Actinomycetota bacterium]
MAATRVLIADDHAGVRQMLRLRLEFSNCQVVGEAANGREAVDLVEETSPDIVVMDLQMPTVDGVEATREIKERWPQIIVFGYTAQAHADRVDDLLAAGATANFYKTQFTELAQAISDHAGAAPA